MFPEHSGGSRVHCGRLPYNWGHRNHRWHGSFSLNQPLEIQIAAPFRVVMSMTNRDPFGRMTPVVQDSNPIISEMTVNGFNLEKFKEVQAVAEKVKETISEAGFEIKDLFEK